MCIHFLMFVACYMEILNLLMKLQLYCEFKESFIEFILPMGQRSQAFDISIFYLSRSLVEGTPNR